MKKSRPSAPTRQSLQLPHTGVWYISVSTFLFLGLLFSYVTSLMLPPNLPTPLTLTLERTKKYPWLVNNHLSLAGIYHTSGNLREARAELAVAEDLFTYPNTASPSVLGEISRLSDLQTKIETSPQEYQKKRAYWQEILDRYPTYRDAWVQLLYLSFNAGDITVTRFYLGKVNDLYPNYVQELPETLRNL